jgi:hypothetical protein
MYVHYHYNVLGFVVILFETLVLKVKTRYISTKRITKLHKNTKKIEVIFAKSPQQLNFLSLGERLRLLSNDNTCPGH